MGLLVALDEALAVGDEPGGVDCRNPGRGTGHAARQIADILEELRVRGTQGDARHERGVVRRGRRLCEFDGIVIVAPADEEIPAGVAGRRHERRMVRPADRIRAIQHDGQFVRPGGLPYSQGQGHGEGAVLVDQRHAPGSVSSSHLDRALEATRPLVEQLHAPAAPAAAPQLGGRRHRRDERPARRLRHAQHGLRDRRAKGAQQRIDAVGGDELPVQTGGGLRVASVVPDHQAHGSSGDAAPFVQHLRGEPISPAHLTDGLGADPGFGDRRRDREGFGFVRRGDGVAAGCRAHHHHAGRHQIPCIPHLSSSRHSAAADTPPSRSVRPSALNASSQDLRHSRRI